MAKIKTLVESLQDGHEIALEHLDRKVEELGEVVIKDVKDSVYPEGYGFEQNASAYIERIVIYKEKSQVNKGEPWKPTLDTNLMEFVNVTNIVTEYMLEKAYDRGKRTIRDLIAMPYTWFFRLDGVEVEKGFNPWDSLRKDLNKYGIKMYKKGNVITD